MCLDADIRVENVTVLKLTVRPLTVRPPGGILAVSTTRKDVAAEVFKVVT